MASSAPARGSWVIHRLALMPAWKRLTLGLLPAAVVHLLTPATWPTLMRLLTTWDAFALTTLLITWSIILKANVGHIRRIATREDPGRMLSFGLVLVLSGVSLVAVVLLLSSMRTVHDGLLLEHVAASIAGVLTAWLLVHTLFTLRYAHLFYSTDAGRLEGGLEFPGSEPEPDYLDFAYFSFTIGMTAQTADVSIADRLIRRVVLVHGILSFGFNTAVVALTISGLAGLL